MAYPATPKTWVAGDVLTAAQLNAELRDALLAAFPLAGGVAGWTSYTPTLTQSATVTKTVTYAKYMKIGRLVTVVVDLAVTGAGTAANAVVVGLPVTAAYASFNPIGSALVTDASAGPDGFTGIVYAASTTTVQFGSTRANGILGGASFTAALAAGDTIKFCATYESAT